MTVEVELESSEPIASCGRAGKRNSSTKLTREALWSPKLEDFFESSW